LFLDFSLGGDSFFVFWVSVFLELFDSVFRARERLRLLVRALVVLERSGDGDTDERRSFVTVILSRLEDAATGVGSFLTTREETDFCLDL